MTYNNAFTDMFKNSFDFNQFFSTQRRNIEALSAANQAIVEGAQAISRRQAEVIRDNVESVLKASKDLMTGGSPEQSVTKNADLAKSIFENSLSHLREITETATKSSFEAFDVLRERTAARLEEFGKATTATTAKKKATA